MPLPPLPAWVNGYINIPFLKHGRDAAGCDCWGLHRLILRNELGIELPAYHGHDWDSPADRREISAFFRGEIADEWRPVWTRSGNTPISEIPFGERPFDGLWLRPKGRNAPIHVGTVVIPGVMIHVEAGCDANVQDYHERWAQHPIWRTQVEGVFRHVSQPD